MNYEFWADATAVLHFAILIGVAIGLLVSYRYKRFRPWEAGILIAIVILWSYYGNCPLTILEEHFRTLAGKPSGITNVGFLPYYANKLLGISLTSRTVQRSTFFFGGVIFTGSIEWISPFMHMEVVRLRVAFRRLFGNKRRKR